MIDHGRLRLLEAVARAAHGYRAAMGRYIGEQARLLDAGVPVEELFGRTRVQFDAVAEAEDALDDALTVLAWYDLSAGGDEQ